MDLARATGAGPVDAEEVENIAGSEVRLLPQTGPAAQSRSMADAVRFRRQIVHLHSLGVRPLAEFLVELADQTDGKSVILDLLAEYERLEPDAVRLVGGDRFPRRVPLLVPR
jgi:hypothetical protein